MVNFERACFTGKPGGKGWKWGCKYQGNNGGRGCTGGGIGSDSLCLKPNYEGVCKSQRFQ